MKQCLKCQNPLAPSRRASTRFCNSTCRNAYHNKMAKGFRDVVERKELTDSTRTWAINLFRESRANVYETLMKHIHITSEQVAEIERASFAGSGKE